MPYNRRLGKFGTSGLVTRSSVLWQRATCLALHAQHATPPLGHCKRGTLHLWPIPITHCVETFSNSSIERGLVRIWGYEHYTTDAFEVKGPSFWNQTQKCPHHKVKDFSGYCTLPFLDGIGVTVHRVMRWSYIGKCGSNRIRDWWKPMP